MTEGQETFLVLLTLVCELLIALCVIFIIVNWYINFHRKEDLPWNKFIPYLICEFWYNLHVCSYDEGVEEMYLICDRCEKVWQYENEKTKLRRRTDTRRN